MNGMIQLVMNDQDFLRKLGDENAAHIENTLADHQRGHHVTIAFNCSDDYAKRWKEGDELIFEAHELRADGEICALFGNLIRSGEKFPFVGEYHVTLRGCVHPKESSRLKPQDVTGSFVFGRFGGTVRFIHF